MREHIAHADLKKPIQLSGEYDRNYYKEKATLEQKHFIMTLQYIEHLKPKSVLDVGCGTGLFMYCFNYFGITAHGLEIKEDARTFAHESIRDSIYLDKNRLDDSYDVIFSFDVLEHLETEAEVDEMIMFLRKKCRRAALFSICMAGDTNYYLDATHRMFRTKSWWINKLETYGFKVVKTPEHFWYKSQILIAKVKK